MKLTSVVPTLYTRDVPGLVEFYTRVLGFECDGDEPDDDVAVARQLAIWDNKGYVLQFGEGIR